MMLRYISAFFLAAALLFTPAAEAGPFANRHIAALTGVSAPRLPAFDYNFADDSGTLDGDFTFTRASDGTQFNSSGTLITQTTNAARVDNHAFDGANWINLGFLIEESRENVGRQSKDFGTTWTTNNASIDLNSTTGVDGSATADTLIEADDTNKAHRLQQQSIDADPTGPVTFSVRVKANGRTFVSLSLGENFGVPNLVSAFYDLTAVTVGTTTLTGTAVGLVASIIDEDNGWRRLSLSAATKVSTTGTRVQAQIHSAAGDNDQTYDGDGVSGIYLDDAQIEVGAFRTSSITTTTGSVIRAADIATITRAPSAAYTMEFETRTGFGAGVLWSYDDGTNQERVYVERNSSNEIHLRGVSGLVEQFDIDLGAVADDTDFKIMFRIAANDIAASLNGGAVGTDTDATMPTVTTQRLGMNYANDLHWNATVSRMKEWASGLDNGYLIAGSTQ